MSSVLRKSALVVPLAAAVSLAAWRVAVLETDNSIAVWLDPASPEAAVYERFRQQFGDDQQVWVLAERRPADDPALNRVAAWLAQDPAVQRCWNPAASVAVLTNLGVSIRSAPRAGMLGLQLHDHSAQTLNWLRQELSRRAPDVRWHLAGPPVVNAELDRLARKDLGVVLPLSLVAGTVVMFLGWRRWQWIMAGVAGAGLSCLLVFAAYELAGWRLNMVTVALAPLVIVLTLAPAIHLIHIATLRPDHTSRQWTAILRRPVVLAALTTCAGFGSLGLSRLEPVRALGLTAAAGTWICAAVGLWGVALLGSSLVPMAPAQPKRCSWSRLTNTVVSQSGLIVLGGVVLMLVMGLGAARVIFSWDAFRYINPTSTTGQAYAYLARQFHGDRPTEVLVRWHEPSPAVAARTERLRQLCGWLQKRDDVGQVMGLGTLLPDTTPWALRMALGQVFSGTLPVPRFVSADGRTDRITAWVQSSKVDATGWMKQVLPALQQMAGPAATVELTGIVPLLDTVQRNMLQTFVRSFSLALAVVVVVMTVGLGSVRDGLAALLPNLLPVGLLFGGLGWLGWNVDLGTMMVASVGLGLAVDDTVHFMATYRRSPAALTTAERLDWVYGHCAWPIVYTSVLVTVGCLPFLASQFQPMRQFGLGLIAVSALALVADLILLPSLLTVLERHGRERND